MYLYSEKLRRMSKHSYAGMDKKGRVMWRCDETGIEQEYIDDDRNLKRRQARREDIKPEDRLPDVSDAFMNSEQPVQNHFSLKTILRS